MIKHEEAEDVTGAPFAKKAKLILTPGTGRSPQAKVIMKKRRSGAMDMDYIKKFGDFGLAGKPQTKRQMSLVSKKMEEKEKQKKSDKDVKKDADSATQHSMEDIVHAEILISLKSAANEDEDEDEDEEDNDDDDDNDNDDEEEGEENDGETEEGEGGQKKKPGRKRKRTDEEDEEEDKEDDAAKAFKCGICSNTFADASTLYAHVTEHKNEYKCDICNEVFNEKDKYVAHLVTHVPALHSLQDSGQKSPKEYKCGTCNKVCSSAKQLETHKNAHYTVVPVKTKSNKVALVVHPSGSIVVKKDSTSDKADAKKKDPDASTQSKNVKTAGNESKDDNGRLEENEGNEREADESISQAADSVDGMEVSDSSKNVADKTRKAEATRDVAGQADIEAEDEEGEDSGPESHLPAFSEIVKDVDEFFIKDTKPKAEEKKNEVEESKKTDENDEKEDEIEETAEEIAQEETVVTSEGEKSDGKLDAESGEFKCVICKVDSGSQQKWIEHMKCHSLFELTRSSIEGKETTQDLEKTCKQFVCKLCGLSLDKFQDLKTHVAGHIDKGKQEKPGGKGKKGQGGKSQDSESKKDGSKGDWDVCLRTKRGRPPIKKIAGLKPKPAESPKGKKAEPGKVALKSSILAAALKSGPKFEIDQHIIEGMQKEQKTKLPNEKGDASSEVTTTPKPVPLPLVTQPGAHASKASKAGEDKASVTETKKGDVQNFASKLLVQGASTFLIQKETTAAKGVHYAASKTEDKPSTVAVTSSSATTQTAPKTLSSIPALSSINPAVLANFVSLSNQTVTVGGKATPIGQVRFITPTEIKNASPQQLIFLNRSSPLSVQLASQLRGSGQVIGAQLPSTGSRQAIPVPCTIIRNVSFSPAVKAGTKSSASSTPTVKQMISAQKTATGSQQATLVSGVPAMVPLSFVKNAAGQGTIALPVSAIQKPITVVSTTLAGSLTPLTQLAGNMSPLAGTLTSAAGNLTLPIGKIASVVSTAGGQKEAAPKIATIPLSGLPIFNPVVTSAFTPAQIAQLEATTRVNPQTQSHLLNMVLARMGQPGAVTVVATTQSIPSTVPIILQSPTTSVAASTSSTIVLGQEVKPPASTASDGQASQSGAQGIMVRKFSKEELLKQAPSLQLKEGLFLFCSKCKQALHSIEEMSDHVCFTEKSESPQSVVVSSESRPSDQPKKLQKTAMSSDVAAAKGLVVAPKTQPRPSSIAATLSTASTPPECLQCVGDPLSLGFHLLIMHNYECKICYARMKKYEMFSHANNHCVNVMKNCIQCQTCKDIFIAMDLFVDHREHCDKKAVAHQVSHMLVKCQGCSLHLQATNIVIWHIKKSHIQRVLYSCSVCKHNFQCLKDMRQTIIDHMKAENEGQAADIAFCHFCLLVFPNRVAQANHDVTYEHLRNYNMRINTLGPVYNKKSPVLKFTGPSGYIYLEPKSSQEKDKSGGDPENTCKDCGHQFSSVFQLRQHRVIRHGHVLKSRPKVPKILAKNFRCEACKRIFHTKLRLSNHQQICLNNLTVNMDTTAK